MTVCQTPLKIRYLSRREAKLARTRLKGRGKGQLLQAYRCDCGFWHLGKLAYTAIHRGRAVAYRGEEPIVRPLPRLTAAPPVAVERLTNVLSAHDAFQTQLCPARNCPHCEPCPKHGDRAAAA